MTKDSPTCPHCNSEMTFKERIKSDKKYRMRRFVCICGYEETVFAGGGRQASDDAEAQKDVDKMYKQSEGNQI